VDREIRYALFGFLGLLALGLILLGLNRYESYHRFIDAGGISPQGIAPQGVAPDDIPHTRHAGAGPGEATVANPEGPLDTSGAFGEDPQERKEPEKAIPEQVDINRADLEELMTLPGVGRVIGLRIIEHRSLHGDFTRIDELVEVNGIGVKKLEMLRDYVIIR
jgi:competence protein ComEA